MMTRLAAILLASTVVSGSAWAQTSPAGSSQPAHSVLLFVADGLRPGMVNAATAPNMQALIDRGVRFANSHSLFPTFTTANASGMATGHLLGDTGDFSNTIYSGFPVQAAGGSVTPFLENDAVIGEVDQHLGASYLDERAILEAARGQGLSTAAIGKVGPVAIFDTTERTGEHTLIADDTTGRAGGIPLSAEFSHALQAASIAAQAPTRGANGQAGTNTAAGTSAANVEQQNWFVDVATKAVMPLFHARNTPFVMVFWSRDPDGTQHNQGDSLGRLIPGINGPTSLAAIKNADDDLGKLIDGLKAQGLYDTTDVILTSDHGFSTISKETATSWSAAQSYAGVTAHQLPPGFVALDVAHALDAKLFDPDNKNAEVMAGSFPSKGNGLIGQDPAHPDVVVAANGGSDLIYLPGNDQAVARRVVQALAKQDYVSGLFVDSKLGRIPGTLPLSAIALEGSALTPVPAIAVNFRTFSLGCADPTTCGVEIADTGLQQGQGMHGSFSRADTRNIMAASGPDFRANFVDEAPASNADLGKTIFRIMGLQVADKGKLVGRPLAEAMQGGSMPSWQAGEEKSDPDENGLRTVVRYQILGDTRYFDVAGYPGRTLGLPAEEQGPSRPAKQVD